MNVNPNGFGIRRISCILKNVNDVIVRAWNFTIQKGKFTMAKSKTKYFIDGQRRF